MAGTCPYCTATKDDILSFQEEEMRAKARQAMEDTKRANKVLQSFKQLEREREEQMDAAIKGALGPPACQGLCQASGDVCSLS